MTTRIPGCDLTGCTTSLDCPDCDTTTVCPDCGCCVRCGELDYDHAGGQG